MDYGGRCANVCYGTLIFLARFYPSFHRRVSAQRLPTYRMYLIYPMLRRRSLASLSLSRFKMAVLPRQQRNGKGGISASRRRLRLFCVKGKDSHHKFCLQPFLNVAVYAKIDITALVVQLPHGKACYVAAEMLQDNFHSVRVALCRCRNDRIRNKGIFRVAGFVTIRPIHQHFPPDIFLISQKSLSVCTVLYFSTY